MAKRILAGVSTPALPATVEARAETPSLGGVVDKLMHAEQVLYFLRWVETARALIDDVSEWRRLSPEFRATLERNAIEIAGSALNADASAGLNWILSDTWLLVSGARQEAEQVQLVTKGGAA